MALSTRTSSASTLMQNSGSETNLGDDRKRKRMLSNRESARRSRMKKQKQVDELMAQVGQLRNENNQIISSINNTRKHYMDTEAENLVLRAQHEELSYRLQYLNEIISNLSLRNTASYELDESYNPFYNPCNFNNYGIDDNIDGLLSQWNVPYLTQQQHPIMASAEMFQY